MLFWNIVYHYRPTGYVQKRWKRGGGGFRLFNRLALKRARFANLGERVSVCEVFFKREVWVHEGGFFGFGNEFLCSFFFIP